MTTPYRPYLVANQRTGQDLSMDPWLIPADAYQEIFDGYQYKGVVNKRDGFSWFDSIPHAIDGGAGNHYQNISTITLTISAQVTTTAAHGLSDGDIVRLTGVGGITSPIGNPSINGTRWTIKKVDATNFTLNNTFAFAGAYTPTTGTASQMPYPGTTMLGVKTTTIATWIDSTNEPHIIVFDAKRASIYDTTINCLVPLGYTDIFSSDNCQWWENYKGTIYFTNNADNIYYYNNLSTIDAGLKALVPTTGPGASGDQITTCLMIRGINERLNLYNTVEGGSRYPTRIRWCAAKQDPTVLTPINPWDSVTPGLGNFGDLTDSIYLISMGQLQYNNLLFSQGQNYGVLYEQRPVNDPKDAYAFIKIATSRNVNSTFGTIVLDRELTAVGNSGLLTTDGNSINRYDDKIPDFAINSIDQNNFQSCFGARYDTLWQTWLLYPSGGQVTNNNALVFNSMDRSWSIYRWPTETNLSCLGQITLPRTDPTWASYDGFTNAFPNWAWYQFGDETWATTPQAQTPTLVAGDYNGNIWLMNTGGGDAADNVVYNAPINNGNAIALFLKSRAWFPYANEGKSAQFGYIDFLIDADASTIATLKFNVDTTTSSYLTSYMTCIPAQDDAIVGFNNILQSNPCKVIAPDHGLKSGNKIWIYGVQGMIQLNNFQFTITKIDADTFTLNGIDSTVYTPYISGGIGTIQPINETTFWKRVWVGQIGVFHQFTLDTGGVDETFALHAAMPWFRPAGRIYRG